MLMELLKSGCSLQDALTFLPRDMLGLTKALKEGKTFLEICETQENAWMRHFCFFYRMATLPDAMQQALHMAEFEDSLRKRFLKQATYPMLILCMAFMMLQLFTRAILPQMLDSFAINADFTWTKILMFVLQFIATCFFILVILMAIALLYLYFHEPLRTYCMEHFASHIVPLRQYCSYMFAGYLKELENSGMNTMDALAFLQEVPIKWMQHLAQRMHQHLLDGSSFLEALKGEEMVTEQLYRCLHMRMLTQDNEHALRIYLTQQELYWERFIKKSGYLMQGIAYGFVAVLVILVFQVLLLPLQMLESM